MPYSATCPTCAAKAVKLDNHCPRCAALRPRLTQRRRVYTMTSPTVTIGYSGHAATRTWMDRMLEFAKDAKTLCDGLSAVAKMGGWVLFGVPVTYEFLAHLL